jgi:hypothetical protein
MILLSKDRTIWKSSDQIKAIDHLLYNSIDEVPQLKILKQPRNLRVIIDKGELEASSMQEIVLEGLLSCDTILVFIDFLSQKVPDLVASFAQIKTISHKDQLIEISSKDSA